MGVDKELKPTTTIVEYFTAPLLRQFSESGFFGKKYIRMGPMYGTVGYVLFQTGGLLGYGLVGYPKLLGELLIQPKPLEDPGTVLIKQLKPLALALLSEAALEQNNLHELYLIPELARVGVDLHDTEFVHGHKTDWMSRKLSKQEDIVAVSQSVFLEGASVGFFFPDTFRVCWEESFKKNAKSEWEEAYKYGIGMNSIHRELSFLKEVSVILRETGDWSSKSPSSSLSRDEESELTRLADHFFAMAV